jgi:hypothetical protein
MKLLISGPAGPPAGTSAAGRPSTGSTIAAVDDRLDMELAAPVSLADVTGTLHQAARDDAGPGRDTVITD